jgi:hypothetical protein
MGKRPLSMSLVNFIVSIYKFLFFVAIAMDYKDDSRVK